MKKVLIYILVLAFSLNLIWEYSHYGLYNDLSGIPQDTHLWLAAFTDAVLIIMATFILSLKNKSFSWIKKTSRYDYIIATVILLTIAIIIEIINLNLGRWSYKTQMPTILGLGLSPLIQLPLTYLITLFLTRKLIYRRHL